MHTFTIMGIAGALLLLCLIILFNTLISRKNRVKYASSSVDTILKKRYDLIPNLVATVQQYMSYEKGLLNQITELRAKAISGNITGEEKAAADGKMGQLLRNIIVSAENYPQLKASNNFLQLQAALNEVEEQISAARRAFVASVTEYNNALQMFPTNIVASAMNYKEIKWFEIPEPERERIDVRGLFEKK